MHGFTKAVLLYIVYFNHRCSNLEGQGGCSSFVKDRDTLIVQLITRINEAHRITVKQVVYEFMKQIRVVGHSFNTTGMENYRVQIAVPLQLLNNLIIVFSKKVNKQVH